MTGCHHFFSLVLFHSYTNWAIYSHLIQIKRVYCDILIGIRTLQIIYSPSFSTMCARRAYVQNVKNKHTLTSVGYCGGHFALHDLSLNSKNAIFYKKRTNEIRIIFIFTIPTKDRRRWRRRSSRRANHLAIDNVGAHWFVFVVSAIVMKILIFYISVPSFIHTESITRDFK